MSDKKYVVPPGMLHAVQEALHAHWNNIRLGDGTSTIDVTLKAVVKWISENPRGPSLEEFLELDSPEMREMAYLTQCQEVCVRWISRMFIFPEPPIPEDIKDMLIPIRNMDEANGPILGSFSCKKYNESILLAYNRGIKSKG